MEKQKKLFSNNVRVFHSKIILSFCIAGINGYNFEQKMLPLFHHPKKVEFTEWKKRIKNIIYGRELLLDKPEFLLSYLNSPENGNTFLYGIKFIEVNLLNKKNPVIILLESSKDDPEEFQHLLFSLYEHFIITKHKTQHEINYNKIEFINILFFLYYNLVVPSPHSSIEINIPLLNKPPFQITFYYSSNFELPCNKTDTNIYKLFSYLDVSIIIRIIFKLLVEKSVLLISQDLNLLNTIVPAISSLLFPIKWTYPFNPICPFFLEQTSPNDKHYLFGCIGGEENFHSLLKVAGENFVVDCDTNEVYNGEKYVPFCPLPTSQFCCSSEKVLMIYDYYKNSLYEIDEKTRKKSQLVLLKNGRVLIDCDDENRLVIELKDNYLSKEEWKELREKIQLLKKEKTFMEIEDENDRTNIENEVDCISNQERSFDYKMKKIFAEIINEKISHGYLHYCLRSSKLMVEFKKVGVFENDSPIRIVKNVFESEEKDSKRNYYNSFRIILDLPHLESSKTFHTIFKKSSFHYIFLDYLELLYHKPKNNKDEPNPNFIYGMEGIVRILDDIENSSKDFDEILKSIYTKQILPYVIKTPIKDEKVRCISFKSENKDSYINCHQFFNYCALLFNALIDTNITIDYPEDTTREEMLLIKVVINFIKGYSLDKDEFPFFAFYSILNKATKKTLTSLKNLFNEISDLNKIYLNVNERKS